MQTLRVTADSIEIGERHRSLNEDACARLMASMKEIGLKQPISIRIVDLMVIDGHECEGVPVLVAGRHRLEAARRLGWSHIDCFEVEDDPVSAELWEIAENLHRCDLTREQRDEHIRRYGELLATRDAEIQVVQNEPPEIGYGKPPPQTKGIALRIAEETGLSRSTVRRALAGEQSRGRRPQRAAGKQLESLKRAWREAGPEARRMFLDSIQRKEAA